MVVIRHYNASRVWSIADMQWPICYGYCIPYKSQSAFFCHCYANIRAFYTETTLCAQAGSTSATGLRVLFFVTRHF